LRGDAAHAWEWIREGKTLSLQLKEGLLWSNDASLGACDYRRGLMAALGSNLGPSPLADLYEDILGAREALLGENELLAKSLRCDDLKQTLEIDVLRPRSWKLLHALAFVSSAPLARDPALGLASGHFKIVEWKKGRSLLIQNREGVQLELLFVRDPNTAFVMYEKKDLDVLLELPTSLLSKLRTRSDFYQFPMMATYYVAFSAKNPKALSDARARRALALSAGREEMPSLLQGGRNSRIHSHPYGALARKNNTKNFAINIEKIQPKPNLFGKIFLKKILLLLGKKLF
jgi:ABC-type oligopeptide transport system substrate-binding subunit